MSTACIFILALFPIGGYLLSRYLFPKESRLATAGCVLVLLALGLTISAPF